LAGAVSLTDAAGLVCAAGLAGAVGLAGAAGLGGGGMENLPSWLVPDESGVEGRKGLAWVGEASTRQVLTEGEGNWICPPHFDHDERGMEI